MKTVFVLLLAIAFLPSCQTSHSTAAANAADSNPFHRFNNLGDALRIYGNLQVSGTGLERKITVRRNGNSTTQPLYVLNGFPIGTNYRRANHLVNMHEVEQIRVLTNLHQLTKYGTDGAGGVILINTQKKPEMVSQTTHDDTRIRPTRRTSN